MTLHRARTGRRLRPVVGAIAARYQAGDHAADHQDGRARNSDSTASGRSRLAEQFLAGIDPIVAVVHPAMIPR
ncbi:MAG TPA: hypothetical protein VFT67_11235 [Jatrophihabitantaceae bacterium]|nr:hypothetical protein [Jatrophihabitantaceae bacterium]